MGQRDSLGNGWNGVGGEGSKEVRMVGLVGGCQRRGKRRKQKDKKKRKNERKKERLEREKERENRREKERELHSPLMGWSLVLGILQCTV